jgi:hypothetical protein
LNAENVPNETKNLALILQIGRNWIDNSVRIFWILAKILE